MSSNSLKLSPQLSIAEEIANSLSHAIGAFLMLCCLPFTAIYAIQRYSLTAAISMSIFNISLCLMLLASAVYHAMPYHSKQKYILRVIDHSMIFVAIAGSYTPVALCLVPGILGYTIILLQWSITLFGILYKIFSKEIHERFSLILYLIMGWSVVLILPSMLRQTQLIFWFFMLLGGISYSIGAVFYSKKKPYYHTIWHFFILLAALLQYCGIVFFMLP